MTTMRPDANADPWETRNDALGISWSISPVCQWAFRVHGYCQDDDHGRCPQVVRRYETELGRRSPFGQVGRARGGYPVGPLHVWRCDCYCHHTLF